MDVIVVLKCRAVVRHWNGSERQCKSTVGDLGDESLSLCASHAGVRNLRTVDGKHLNRKVPCVAVLRTGRECGRTSANGWRYCAKHTPSDSEARHRAIDARKERAQKARETAREMLLFRVSDILRRSGVEDAEQLVRDLEKRVGA